MSCANYRWLHSVAAWSLIFIIHPFTALLFPASAQSGDESAIRSLAERFFTAYGSSDLDGLMLLWNDSSPHLATSREGFRQTFTNSKVEFKSLQIGKISVDGDKATVRIVASITASDVKSGKPSTGLGAMNRTLHCVKAGEQWKVWQYVSSEQELVSALASVKTNEERKALLEAEKELMTVELVRRLLAEGRHLQVQGRYKEALDVFGVAVVVANRMDDRSRTAAALRDIGNVHQSQGNYTEALRLFQESLKITGEISDRQGVAVTLNNIGMVHISQGNYTQALELFQSSLKIKEEIDGKPGMAVTLNNIGRVYNSQGNYTQALEYYQKSLQIREAAGDRQGIAQTLNEIGLVHTSQGNHTQAVEYYQKSLQIVEELENKQWIARALNNIGMVHSSQGNHAQALEYYQKSLKIEEEIGDKQGEYSSLNNMGIVHASQRNYTQALEYYQKSLKIAEKIGNREGIAETLSNIGAVCLSQGEYTQAIEIANRVAAIAEQIGSPDAFWGAISVAGQAHRALNRPDQASQAFDRAIVAIERLRTQVAGSEQDSQRFFEDKLGPYHQMFQLLVDQNDPGQAFAYAERGKARALLDTLQTGRTDISKAMTADERELERKLNAEITSLNSEIYREKLRDRPDSSRLTQLTALLEKARLDYEAFNISLYAAHPELRVYRGQMQPVTLDQATGLIPDSNTALLEYVVTEEKAYLFTLTARRQPKKAGSASTVAPALNVYTLNVKQKDLADRVKQFHRKLANKDFGYHQLAGDLYHLLLAPAQAALHDKTNLIIVPDGPLWNLPFQALQSAPKRFLIENAAISYAPSLTALSAMTKPRMVRTTASTRLLAFANPLVSGQTAKTVNSVYMDERLAPLPEAERQVKLLARLYGPTRSKIYIGPQAREDRVKTEAAGYRILHLAAHGILNDKNPMYSQLVLSQGDESANEDGMLEAWEIAKLDLKTDLVVLSACETARGRVGNGEGMIGLTWSFFVAGVPSTVASQWQVESVSTSELMVEFHRNLNLRMSKAEALRQASLKILRSKSYKHPLYWAGFIVIGDGR